jgi:hypothetical protein
LLKWAATGIAALALVACGGGGGSAGTSVFDGGTSSSSSDSTTGTTTAAYSVTVAIERSGSATTSITSTESVQAVAKVVSKSGAAVEGAVVTFSQASSLIAFSPTSATALTGSDGRASVDLAASAVSSTGATTVTATASVSGSSYSGSAAFEIKAGMASSTVVTPQAINFISVNPADRSIVIKGSGGNGRSESATLTFKVVDASNAPIKGATVTFSVSPAGKVTLNSTTGTSNADGLVTTTVQSGSVATSVVVTATATANASASAPSDTLLVSNGSAVVGGFEIVAKTYNLDGWLTGDSTTVSAYVRDANGNPVADGLAVSFTTDYGAVASSTLGGCLTSNGTCSVSFRVQAPRGQGLATVVGSVLTTGEATLSDAIQINMPGATGGYYAAYNASGVVVQSLRMSSCKQTFEFKLKDSDTLRAPSAGTTISSGASSTGITLSVTSGSPVLDQLEAGFPAVDFTAELSVSESAASPVCVAGGTATASGFTQLVFKSSGGISFTQRVTVVYPIKGP